LCKYGLVIVAIATTSSSSVTPLYPQEAPHCQELLREIPKTEVTTNFLEIQPNFKLVRESWNKTARVPPIFATFIKVQS